MHLLYHHGFVEHLHRGRGLRLCNAEASRLKLRGGQEKCVSGDQRRDAHRHWAKPDLGLKRAEYHEQPHHAAVAFCRCDECSIERLRVGGLILEDRGGGEGGGIDRG